MWIYFFLGAIVLFNIARCGADLADEAINKASSTVEEKANQSVNFGSLRKVYQKEFEEANSTKISGDNFEDLYEKAYILVAYSYTKGSDGRSSLTTIQKDILEKIDINKKKDEARESGLKIWRQLASAGHTEAQVGLAWHFGINKNHQEAYFWRRIASMSGHSGSAQFANYHEAQLSSDLIEEVESRIKSFNSKS